MDKIILSDVYIPVDGESDFGVYQFDGVEKLTCVGNVNKHTGMIVLTVEQFQWHVDEFKCTAFDEGYKEGANDSNTMVLEKLIEFHNSLAKSNLSSELYNPISKLLCEVKLSLFTNLKNKTNG